MIRSRDIESSNDVEIKSFDYVEPEEIKTLRKNTRAPDVNTVNLHIEEYIDEFWEMNIENKESMSKSENDEQVHKLIHRLLVLGETNPKSLYQIHLQKGMLHHQELILAVKDKIKPGLINIAFRRFTKEMLKKYFISCKSNQVWGGIHANFVTTKHESNYIEQQTGQRKKLMSPILGG